MLTEYIYGGGVCLYIQGGCASCVFVYVSLGLSIYVEKKEMILVQCRIREYTIALKISLTL